MGRMRKMSLVLVWVDMVTGLVGVTQKEASRKISGGDDGLVL